MRKKRLEEILKKEAEYRDLKIRELEESITKMNEEFSIWKERVLKFEHIESGIDDYSDGDDLVCCGECVRADENEDAVQRPAGETDGGT